MGKCKRPRMSHSLRCLSVIAVAGVATLALPTGAHAQVCSRSIAAKVVALDQVFFWNRMGAVQPQGMIYALRRDVVDKTTGKAESEGGTLTAGNVKLREDKRPRPITLRMNVGDCLQIVFQNLLAPSPVDDEQPATRSASVRVLGLQLVGDISSDGSFVGALRSTSASKHPPRRGASDNV